MKDIDNYKLAHVQDALFRLDRVLSRLESVAGKAVPAPGGVAESAALAEKLDRLTQAHGALKETTGRVAQGLDAAIGRLSALVRD